MILKMPFEIFDLEVGLSRLLFSLDIAYFKYEISIFSTGRCIVSLANVRPKSYTWQSEKNSAASRQYGEIQATALSSLHHMVSCEDADVYIPNYIFGTKDVLPARFFFLWSQGIYVIYNRNNTSDNLRCFSFLIFYPQFSVFHCLDVGLSSNRIQNRFLFLFQQ